MSDTDGRVAETFERRDSVDTVEDGIATLLNGANDDSDEGAGRHTAEVADIHRCRTERDRGSHRTQFFSDIASEHVGERDTDTGNRCEPSPPGHRPGLHDEGTTESPVPAGTAA